MLYKYNYAKLSSIDSILLYLNKEVRDGWTWEEMPAVAG
jgi:hypothetical protein